MPCALGAAAFVYGAAYVGQGLALQEMYVLRRYLDDCLDTARTETSSQPTPATPEDSAAL